MRSRQLVLIVAVACLVPALLDAAGTAVQALLAGQTARWNEVIWQGAEWLIFGALTPLAWLASQRYPLRWPMPRAHMLWHLASALILCILWASLGMFLRWILGIADPSRDGHIQLVSWMITSVPWSVFMYFSVAGSMQAFDYWADAQSARATTSRLEAQLANARLDGLRRQLHPHFLFNSLNAITVLVRDRDATGAEGMLDRLSRMLRTVLRDDQGQLVTLADDVSFARDYLAIEQVRFPDRLRVTWDIPESASGVMVPAMLVQPLVENTIRHAVAPHERTGTLEIAARTEGGVLVLTVIDDGPDWLPADASVRGVGLRNTRERLSTLYGSRATFSLARETGRTVATVRIPTSAVTV